ncbi:hypothetical protein JNB88_05835 [Rhizobium cauense]|uniref:hypothetical protein n=1 Tax=Rhizobium cauense TaxID=1166683 RepID=UPI001C6F5908|nr:hypothetical protein [Rhizobium cauense]MBW9113168.1 hypothetical protein [Rhizobium cauense]
MMGSTPYIGPGLWVRIQHRFGPRMMEWFLAGHTALWGYVLLMPVPLFDQPAWSTFRDIFRSEDLLGWLMVALGILRIIGLIVNGARKHVTPRIRQVSAAIGCLIWVGISYCYASSNVVSTWLAIYPLFAIGELVNIKRAAHDEREARNGKAR